MRPVLFVVASCAAFVVTSPSPVDAQVVAPLAAPSDPRAQFVSGNATTCLNAGIVAPGVQLIQVGAQGNASASDVNVSGVVQAHAGGGEELNVTITGGASVVIDGVVVKGGNGFNRYIDPDFLPPTLPPPQAHIPPLVGIENVARISHWFICYHETDPLPTGTLEVIKTVILPPGLPVTPIPSLFSALVNCDDGNPAHENVLIDFNVGGGRSLTPNFENIPVGTVCTIIEQTSNAPTVTYTPADADSTGVTIPAEGGGVVVNINNDFSEVPVQHGTVQFVKQLAPPPAGVTPPPTFTVDIACDDGTLAAVTLPGTGGAGTPDVSVRTLSVCAFIEAPSSLPGGWTVTDQLGNGPPSATPPLIPVVDSSTVTITVINDASAVEPPTTTSTTTTVPPVVPTSTLVTTTTIGGGSGVLPPTGGSGGSLVGVAAICVTAGAALVISRRRSVRSRERAGVE